MLWNMVEAGLVWDLLGGGGLGPRLILETLDRNGGARRRRARLENDWREHRRWDSSARSN